MCNPIADDNCPLDQISIIIITCLAVGIPLMCICACVCNICLGNHPCHGFGKGVRRRRRYSYSVSYSGGGGGDDGEHTVWVAMMAVMMEDVIAVVEMTSRMDSPFKQTMPFWCTKTAVQMFLLFIYTWKHVMISWSHN